MSAIYISKEGQQYGPYSLADLDQMLESGSLSGDDFFWHAHADEWRPMFEFPGYAAPTPAVSGPSLPLAASVTGLPRAAPSAMSGCMLAFTIVGVVGVLTIGACLLVVSGAFSPLGDAAAKGEQRVSDVQSAIRAQLATLATATPSDLQPDGDFQNEFKLSSNVTTLQREAAKAKLKGTLVQWTLKVHNVSSHGEAYHVRTNDLDKVSTIITVYPRNPTDKQRLLALKVGDPITVRGYIADVVPVQSVEIEPAILLP